MVKEYGFDICYDQHWKNYSFFKQLLFLQQICELQHQMSYPTRIPSSISVGATESARSTTNLANCFTLIMYLGSSESALIIFVHRAT